MTTKSLRCVLYLRVSSRKQVDGVSLEDQEHLGRAHAARMGWIVVRMYIESGRSAFTEDLQKRVAFQQMLTDAAAGQFDVVLVYKLNRFARNVPMQYQAAAQLERVEVQIASVTEPIERATASGRATFGMLAVMAQLQSDQLSEKMRDTRLAEARAGRHVGPVPVGYNRREDGILIPSSDAEAVQRAAQLRASGQHSYTSIAKILNEAGWRIPDVKTGTRKPFTKFAVEELLKNEVYIGKVQCKGQAFEGKHEPLIDEATWARIREVGQARTDRPGRSADRVVKTPSASLFDLAYCVECGARMWFQPPSGTRKRAYYLCSQRATRRECGARMVQADVVDEAMLTMMQLLAVPEELHAEILRRAAKLASPSSAPTATDQTGIQVELRALKLAFADDHISESTFKKEKARLQAALAGQPAEHSVPDIAKVASHLWDMPALLTQATPLERNAVYRGIFDRVWIEAHKIRAVTPTRIYERLMIVTSQVIHYDGPGGHLTQHGGILDLPMFWTALHQPLRIAA
jgi:site-specific DNA recombinase